MFQRALKAQSIIQYCSTICAWSRGATTYKFICHMTRKFSIHVITCHKMNTFLVWRLFTKKSYQLCLNSLEYEQYLNIWSSNSNSWLSYAFLFGPLLFSTSRPYHILLRCFTYVTTCHVMTIMASLVWSLVSICLSFSIEVYIGSKLLECFI